MWTIAFLFTTLGSGINMLLSLRRPSIVITAIVAQLLSFPLGKAWGRWMPAWKWTVFGYTMHLNPGPFNIKEHTLIVVCIRFVSIAYIISLLRTSVMVEARLMLLTFSSRNMSSMAKTSAGRSLLSSSSQLNVSDTLWLGSCVDSLSGPPP
jgi:hypothetical protein